MKILHTSDWHLGRSFHGASLLDDQREMVERVLEIAAAESVDLVVVAGDLYDRAFPPVPAVALFDEAVGRLAAAGVAVAAIAGNHDSAVRVGAHDRLLNQMGVAVRGDVARVDEPLVLADPVDGGPPVAVYLVPYLEPAAVGAELLGSKPHGRGSAGSDGEPRPGLAVAPDAPDTLFDLLQEEVAGPVPVPALAAVEDDGSAPGRATHRSVTRAATDRIRRHLAGQGPVRSVVVAHAFVAGGQESDSERDLAVGNAGQIPLGTFFGFDLVALGHLHAPQAFGQGTIAYSGSPLPYSFSEESPAKSVRLVELAPDGSVEADVRALTGVGRPVRTLTGSLDHLLTDRSLAAAEGAYVRALITDRHLPDQPMARLQQRFPHALQMEHRPLGALPTAPGPASASGDARTPLELTLAFWTQQHDGEITDDERTLLAAAVAHAEQAEAVR